MSASAGALLRRAVGATAIYLLTALAAYGQNLYGCIRPTGTPPIPDGSLATLADIQAAREAVEAFLTDGEAYVSCLAQFSDDDDPLVAAINDQVTMQMDLAVIRFNDALCAFSAGTQCAETEAEEGSAAGPGQGAAAASPTTTLPGSAQDVYDVPDHYAQPGLPAAAIGMDNGGSVGLPESAQTSLGEASVLQPAAARQIEEPSSEEPTLPDGTPCGSVTQIRNDVSGDGLSLRGHYAWDVYNACFEPIRVRWTFRGDGLLVAERSIPARGAQRIGCSTRAGTASSRYCTGGIEYTFEWQ